MHTNLRRISGAARGRRTSKPPKRLFGNAPVRMRLERQGEGTQVHPFDYLRATRPRTPLLFLRNSLFFSLFLFWQKRRKADKKGLKHIGRTRTVFVLCAKREGKKEKVCMMKEHVKAKGVSRSPHRSEFIDFMSIRLISPSVEKEMSVINAPSNLIFFVHFPWTIKRYELSQITASLLSISFLYCILFILTLQCSKLILKICVSF